MLPLFPLRIVVFPNEDLNLHIFEPRYKQLMNECDAQDITFGIVPFIGDNLQNIGTEIELLSIEKRYPDGRMDVKTKALGLFRIVNFYKNFPDKLYAGAEIENIGHTMEGDPLQNRKLIDLAKKLFGILSIDKELPSENDLVTYDIAHLVGLSLGQKYQLLSILQETARQEFLLNHLENLIPFVEEMEEVRKRAQMNGHFRNIIPPEF